MTNVLKGSTRAPTEAVEVETAWEATTGLEEVEEDLDLAEVVVGGGPDLLEVRSTNKSLMKLYAMQIPALFGIFLLLPALNMFLFPAGGSGGGSTGADSWW